MAAAIQSLKTTLLDNGISPVVLEMMRLFPDGLVVASGIFALLTLSYPYAAFFGAMLESSLILTLLNKAATYLNMTSATTTRASYTDQCRSGYSSTDYSTLTMFGGLNSHISFPSPHIFMLSAASSYIFGSLSALSKELEVLGPAFSSRYYMSLVFLSFLLFMFIIFRTYYGCDTLGVILFTIPVGLLTGLVILEQNRRLFGIESVNLVSVPILRNRAANGRQIYVCPK